MQIISGLIGGLVFGLGLLISGMANPAKVQKFLDLFGTWDPSLAFVMGGAIAVTLPGFKLVGTRLKPLFSDVFQLPTRTDFDSRLLTGAATFGVGWGLGGFCPRTGYRRVAYAGAGNFGLCSGDVGWYDGRALCGEPIGVQPGQPLAIHGGVW